MDRKKNIVMMIGRNDTTEPTPLKMPLITRSCMTGLTSLAIIIACTALARALIPCSRRSWKKAPITLKVRKNTTPIIRMKIGIAVYFPVRILSIL